jgi:hypothetical protein
MTTEFFLHNIYICYFCFKLNGIYVKLVIKLFTISTQMLSINPYGNEQM